MLKQKQEYLNLKKKNDMLREIKFYEEKIKKEKEFRRKNNIFNKFIRFMIKLIKVDF